MKLDLKKVNSKKALEAQGYCRIDFNLPYWGLLSDSIADGIQPPKYVLVAVKEVTFSNGGDEGLMTTACYSIKEALNVYNSGIIKYENNLL
jgi:hypothetical protein